MCYTVFMRIYIASDHAGFELKTALSAFLQSNEHDVVDVGPHAFDPHDDYPDFCMAAATAVVADAGSFGIVIGLSGQGEAMAANRVQGARAAVFYGGPEEIVTLSREHNDANVLSLGAKFLTIEEAQAAVALWLATPFSQGERHLRRITKLDHA